jgi:very-short-patch-repair endonuclease
MSQDQYKRHFTPEERAAASKRFSELRQTAEFQENLQAYYNSERNPFKDPEQAEAVRAKAHVAMRANGYSMLNGGNGKPLPLPQQMLALALGWKTEFAVSTGARIQGRPTNYKIDIAEPALMIGIEIDGQSHLSKDRKEQDQRKDAFLQEMGWTILRVTNREVLENVGCVIEQIAELARSSTLRQRQATTLLEDC